MIESNNIHTGRKWWLNILFNIHFESESLISLNLIGLPSGNVSFEN